MHKTVFYSTGCPNCIQLKKLLDKNNIPYIENTNREEMLSLGFDRVPVLEYGGKYYNYDEAISKIMNGEVK